MKTLLLICTLLMTQWVWTPRRVVPLETAETETLLKLRAQSIAASEAYGDYMNKVLGRYQKKPICKGRYEPPGCSNDQGQFTTDFKYALFQD